MAMREFWLVYACILVSMLACRCLPFFLLRGRSLPPRVEEAISLIPAAAFSALVANDLLDPSVLANGPLDAVMTLVAAGIVALVARRTGSLIWCALVGMVAYGVLVLAL